MRATAGCTSREGFRCLLAQAGHKPRYDDNGRLGALAPAEAKNMLALGPEHLGREVVPDSKQPWTGAAAVESQGGHVELDAAIFLAHEQLLRQRTPVCPRRCHLG